MNLEVEVLGGGWGLPQAAEPLVERLVQGWESGHTALRVSREEAAVLAASKAVGPGEEPTPLVLHDGLLQSWRFWEAERWVAGVLKSLADGALPQAPAGLLAGIEALGASGDLGADQKAAVLQGLARRLTLITGGPGTGKTHTAAFLLAARLCAESGLRFALAAPTAKAARRLGAEIQTRASKLPAAFRAASSGLGSAMDRARSLHQWLGYNPGTGRCFRDEERPLDVDLVVVDEASMMDALLWRALLKALPRGASLVVLGDANQLESVEAGRVLGVLVQAASAGALKGCHAPLERNFRFASVPGIGRLARAVLERDSVAVLAAAPPPEGSAQALVEGLRAPSVSVALDRVWGAVRELAQAAEPAAALKALGRLRMLCAVNDGPWGVAGVNAAVEARLGREFNGREVCRPVLVTANDPGTGLNNGDLGALLPGPGTARACFDRGDGERSFTLAALPRHETAWAMSVHKSQGSEYETVLIVLPPVERMSERTKDLLSPELLYTAVTRARSRVVLCASPSALDLACRERGLRVSGLDRWLS